MFTRKQLIQLLIPLIIEQAFNVLVGMVDIMMVAGVGEAAVSGVALVDSINIVIISFLTSLATGGAIICSQHIGMNRPENACKSADQLLTGTTIFGIAVSAILMLSGSSLLPAIFGSVENSVMSSAVTYYKITVLSFPFLAIFNSCSAVFRAMGNSKVSMLAAVIMNVINIAGNAICIFVLKMGVAGVAVPTLVSRITAAVILWVLLTNPKRTVHVSKKPSFKFDKKTMLTITTVGIPTGIEGSLFQIGKLILQSLVSSLGTTSIAAYAVCCNVVMLEYLPGNAIGIGLITIVGQCIGAGRFDDVKRYTRKMLILNYTILAVICTLLGIFGKGIVGIYNLSPQASSLAFQMVFMHGFMMLIWPLAFTLGNAVKATSDTTFSMITAVISMIIFRVGFSYLFVYVFKMDIIGVWTAMGIDWIVRAIVFIVRFKSRHYIKLHQ